MYKMSYSKEQEKHLIKEIENKIKKEKEKSYLDILQSLLDAPLSTQAMNLQQFGLMDLAGQVKETLDLFMNQMGHLMWLIMSLMN